ncbi:MAG: family 43 glycosylhydrolase [Verrucomicrobiota bacterium]
MMKWMVSCALCLVSFPAPAAPVSPPAFSVRLEGVKFDYPGAEHWAEIEGPGGDRLWAFAIYTGKQDWTVPFSAEKPGHYKLLRVERRQGDRRADDVLGKDSSTELDVASSQAAAPPAAVTPDLVGAGEFKAFFAATPPWCLNDHTFIQGPDKTWHLFAITHPKPLIWEKDPGRSLAHAASTNLLQSWQGRPPAVTADWEKYHEYLLWAPYVLRNDDTYYMYVCAGDRDTHHYQIHLLTSTNLESWTRSPANPVLVDGFDARDPMVMKSGGEWILYYVANSTPDKGNHQVVCVTSKDLVHWGDRRVVFTHPRAGSFGGPTESPFVVRRGDRYFLFVCDNEWTDVYVSNDPFHWDFRDKTTRIRAHAAEVVRDAGGRWYLSHAGWTEGPLMMAPLNWNDGQKDPITNIAPAEK